MAKETMNSTDVITIALTDEMKIELGDTLASLNSGQVRLQRILDAANVKIQQQDDKIALLVQLVDSHQHKIEAMGLKGNPVQ